VAKSAKRANRSEAIVFINKLEAARRQLDAAIRMLFANEDGLAIHTVAGAAYRILRDMLAKRGQHDLENLMRRGLIEYARSFLKGEISDVELKDMKILDHVSIVAKQIRDRIDVVTEDEINLELNEKIKASHWQSMSKVANFLKHADRDTNSSLSLQDLDNERLLLHACAAYAMVSHTSSPEMVIFHLYWSAASDRREGLDPDSVEIANFMSRLSLSRRRGACRKFIRLCKRGELPF
jgi:hypothetical protein